MNVFLGALSIQDAEACQAINNQSYNELAALLVSILGDETPRHLLSQGSQQFAQQRTSDRGEATSAGPDTPSEVPAEPAITFAAANPAFGLTPGNLTGGALFPP